ncbi:hypothetical protein FQN54_005140 [Arachnomyces sp. PD_36]|nr:hypothetical protein FQN54_005140 [Arachnomyces sp. PD_36]
MKVAVKREASGSPEGGTPVKKICLKPEWRGVIAKNLPVGDKKQMERKLFEPTTTQIDSSTHVIANKKGMDLFRTLKDMGREIRALRTRVLDDWAQYDSDITEIDQRNDVAHGGNIKVDIKVIELMHKAFPPRADQWKRGFVDRYGIPFDTFKEIDIDDFPERLEQVLNTRATVLTMKRWNPELKKSPKVAEEIRASKNEILSNCETIIHRWRTKGNANLLEEGSESEGLYLRIQELVIPHGNGVPTDEGLFNF